MEGARRCLCLTPWCGGLPIAPLANTPLLLRPAKLLLPPPPSPSLPTLQLCTPTTPPIATSTTSPSCRPTAWRRFAGEGGETSRRQGIGKGWVGGCEGCAARLPHPTSPSPGPLSCLPPPLLAPPPCRFFEDYKKNENKVVVVDEFLGRKDALRIIREAMVGGGGLLGAVHDLLAAPCRPAPAPPASADACTADGDSPAPSCYGPAPLFRPACRTRTRTCMSPSASATERRTATEC